MGEFMKAYGRREVLILTCWACISLTVSLPAQTSAVKASDETAIREIVNKYLGAREKKDAQAVEELFTKDADQLVSSGEWRRGRGEIVKGTLASSEKSGGKRTITVESIRFVTPDVALVDGRYELTGLAGGMNRKMWTTLILIHGSDGWHITAIRNMLPAAPVPSR